MSPAIRALLISPALAAVATPIYATWLLSEMIADSVFSAGTIPIIGRLSLIVLAYMLPLSYLVLASYGAGVYLLLRTWGALRLHWLLIVAALPGALMLLSPFSYQESVVPGVFFGMLIALSAWLVLRSHVGANNSVQPTPFRGAA